jgi:tetratricopeptide (TPR) repeat protein
LSAGRSTVALVLLAGATAAQEPPPRGETALPELTRPSLETRGPDAERRIRIEEALRARAYDRAETLLIEAVEREPQSAELLRVLGGVFFLRGNSLGAAIAFKKAEALTPLDERSRFTLTMAYVAMGRRDWARPELGKLAAAAPRNARYVYWSARLDYDDGLYAAAVEGFLRAIDLDRSFMKAHDNLGLSYEALGRFEEAIGSYREAVRLNRAQESPSPWPPLNLGRLLSQLDRLDEAEELVRESVRLDPRFPQGRYELGVLLERKSAFGDAVRELEEAARLDPRYAEPQYALARIHRRRGETEKADQALQRFLQLKAEKRKGSIEPGGAASHPPD